MSGCRSIDRGLRRGGTQIACGLLWVLTGFIAFSGCGKEDDDASDAGTDAATGGRDPLGQEMPLFPPGELFIDELSSPAEPTFSIEDFGGAEYCGSCHRSHYAQWEHSAHANAMKDPVFLGLIRKMREDVGDTSDMFCTQCHSPIGTRSHDIRPGFELSDLSPITLQGVTCEGCHLITEMARPFNSGAVIEPGAPVQGPFGSDLAPHATVATSILDTPDFCGGCHDVALPTGLPLETPFEEYKKSGSRVTCQECHMPTTEGQAVDQEGIPVRELHSHRFTSVDVPAAYLKDPQDPIVMERLYDESKKLLQASADMAVEGELGPAGASIRIDLTNLIPSHRLPTGSSFNRQFWIYIKVDDANGMQVYETGHFDENGDLRDVHDRANRREDRLLVTIGAILWGHNDFPTLFPWRADRIEHSIIEPGATRGFRFQFPVEDSYALPLEATVEFRFRSFSPRLLRALEIEDEIERPRVVTIVKRELLLDYDEAP